MPAIEEVIQREGLVNALQLSVIIYWVTPVLCLHPQNHSGYFVECTPFTTRHVFLIFMRLKLTPNALINIFSAFKSVFPLLSQLLRVILIRPLLIVISINFQICFVVPKINFTTSRARVFDIDTFYPVSAMQRRNLSRRWRFLFSLGDRCTMVNNCSAIITDPEILIECHSSKKASI